MSDERTKAERAVALIRHCLAERFGLDLERVTVEPGELVVAGREHAYWNIHVDGKDLTAEQSEFVVTLLHATGFVAQAPDGHSS